MGRREAPKGPWIRFDGKGYGWAKGTSDPPNKSTLHPLPISLTSDMHRRMRLLVLIGGVVALLIGLLWVGQGAGLIHWPASSFMVDQRPWVTRGAILAVAGLVMISMSRARL